MIAKIRRGSYFRGLQLYLLSELKGVAPEDVELRCLVSVDTAAAEMRLAAGRSKRIQRAVYHIILAWAEEEQPSRDDQFAIGSELLERVGLAGHQALLVRHSEAKAGAVPGGGRHYELHFMVNRVGPDGRAAAMRNDYAMVERAVADIATARSMRVVSGRHNGQAGFVQGSSEAARSVASATGRLSPAMELRGDPNAMADLTEARVKGWTALVEAFARRGLRLAESNRTARAGQSAGLVLVDVADEKRREKISALDTPDLKWGRPTLERELGAFPIEAAGVSLARPPTMVQVSPSPAQRTRSEFDAAREAALAERRRLGKAHDEAKRHLLAGQAVERQRLLSMARRRRSALVRFFGRGSEVAAAINLVLDGSFAGRLGQTLDGHRQDVQAMMDRHSEALGRVPVPTWTDWRRAGRHGDVEDQSTLDHRGPYPKAEQSQSAPIPDRSSPDHLAGASVASTMMALDEHDRRRERLARNREKKATLKRGALDARIAAVADDFAVAVAASIIWHLRSRHGRRILLLAIAALAAGSGIAPVVLAAAAAALVRCGEIRSERVTLRADVDVAKAARTGWVFPTNASPDRLHYAALVRSNLFDPAGPDAGPLIVAVGQQQAALFVAWWAYATPKQRAVVERWDRPRPKQHPRSTPRPAKRRNEQEVGR